MSRADAIAAIPRPSPVNPMPSVVVASTETLAPPSAADNVAIASLRRLVSFGRLPMRAVRIP